MPHGTTYAEFGREDLEKWLNSLGKKWSRKSGTSGVYLIHLSDHVAVKLSSTLSGRNRSVDYAKGSMQLSLVSLVNGRVLNKKAQGQSHFKRTLNWETTWKKGVDRMAQAYMKYPSFYDAKAMWANDQQYQNATLPQIESIEGWASNNFLKDLHTKVKSGTYLSTRQLEAIERARERAQKEVSTPTPSRTLTPQQQRFLERLRALREKAEEEDDQWLLSFLSGVQKRIDRETPLTDKQRSALKRNLQRYRVA